MNQVYKSEKCYAPGIKGCNGTFRNNSNAKLEKVFSYKTQRLFKVLTCTLNADVPTAYY